MPTVIYGDETPSLAPTGTQSPGSSVVATGSATSEWTPRDFNVLAFGAKGDGATDDTSAIQSTIDAGAGGEVVLPPTAGGYLISAPLTLATAGTVLRGGGAENTKILIGPAFTGAEAVSITAYNCQVLDLSVSGASSTTTSNPVADAIKVTGVRRAKVLRCSFFYINGWCIEAAATNASSTSNPFGTQIANLCISSCAGGLHFLGNTTQGYAVNSLVSNVHIASGGVTSGASANLDGIKIEDAWDVLIENAISWTTSGSGSCLHVKGNSAATFVNNLDALGPNGGPCVLIEDGTNGSPQNTQISGGVIQQGSPGILISGAAKQVHIHTSRIINNETHGITVSGTATTIYLSELFFSLNGAGASGTNYDLNWSGTALGYVTNARFASSIVSSGTAGVQESVNLASAGQAVRFINPQFLGTGQAVANWFNTNLPAGLVEVSSGAFNFVTNTKFSGATAITPTGNIAAQPTVSGNTILSGNVTGSDAFDRLRLLANSIAMGPGTAARDAQIARTATGLLVVSNPATAHAATLAIDGNAVVGAAAGLGDNGVGELAYANASTVPSTNPTGGVVTYASGGQLFARDPSGNVYALTRAAAVGASSTTVTGTTAKTLLAAGLTVPAGGLAAQQVYRFVAWGTLSTVSSSDTFTLALYWGGISGTQFFTWGAQQPSASSTATNASWIAMFEITSPTATTFSVAGWDGLDYYFSSETEAGTTVSNASAEQMVLGVTPSASGDSITCAGSFCYRVA